MQQIINKLSELFSIKNDVEKEITEILESIRTCSNPTNEKPTVMISKSPGPVKSKRGRKRKEREYYCNKCELSFKSNLPKIDCVCPKCGSIHIVAS